MGETIALLREAFQTSNQATLPISGTGSAGMEAMVANFVDPGDRVVCGVNGLFGVRMADELARAGADVVKVEADWGRAIDPELLIAAASDGLDAMVVVHGETSTGVAQPLDGLADACHERDALLMIDCVTSLGGHPLRIDEAGVDAAFSGTQKCLNCPPGLAPLTANERALAKLAAREQPGRSWYFDLSLVLGYWDPAGGSGRRCRGARPRLSPHRPDQHDLRAARGAADRGRRRVAADDVGATPPRAPRAARRARGLRLRASGARRRAAALAARGDAAGGHRRGRRAARPAARARDRDLRRAGPARRASCGGSGSWARAPGASRRSASSARSPRC